MTLKISDELAMLAVSVARYEEDGSDDAKICMRFEAESALERVRSYTQPAYDRYRAAASDEFSLQIEADASGVVPALELVKA